MAGILFEDIFDVKDIDPDGKKFERGKQEVVNQAVYFVFVLFFVSVSVVLWERKFQNGPHTGCECATVPCITG